MWSDAIEVFIALVVDNACDVHVIVAGFVLISAAGVLDVIINVDIMILEDQFHPDLYFLFFPMSSSSS